MYLLLIGNNKEFKDMKNHAFLIQTHSYPELTEEIVGLLESPNHYFFLHVDAKQKNIDCFRDICKKYQNTILIKNRLKVNGGGDISV